MINSINTYSPQNRFYKQAKVTRHAQNINFEAKKEWYFNKKLNEFAEKIASKEKVKDFIFKAADNKTLKALVEWASKEKTVLNKNGEKVKDCNTDKLNQYLIVGYSAFLQTLHIRNIMKNKQMPEERKETLAINNILAFIIPTIGAFTIDKSINKGMETFQKYAEKVKKQKFNEDQLKGLKTFKSVLIFGMMYKYFATIITTPLADVTTDFLRDKGIIGKTRNKAKTKQLVG